MHGREEYGTYRNSFALRKRKSAMIWSHNYRTAYHGFEFLSQTHYVWLDFIGQPDIHDQYVISFVMNDTVQQGNELSVTLPAHPALENGKLHPLSKRLHRSEYFAPALRIGDIVRDDVQVLAHVLSREKLREIIDLTEQEASHQSRLDFQQPSIRDPITE